MSRVIIPSSPEKIDALVSNLETALDGFETSLVALDLLQVCYALSPITTLQAETDGLLLAQKASTDSIDEKISSILVVVRSYRDLCLGVDLDPDSLIAKGFNVVNGRVVIPKAHADIIALAKRLFVNPAVSLADTMFSAGEKAVVEEMALGDLLSDIAARNTARRERQVKIANKKLKVKATQDFFRRCRNYFLAVHEGDGLQLRSFGFDVIEYVPGVGGVDNDGNVVDPVEPDPPAEDPPAEDPPAE